MDDSDVKDAASWKTLPTLRAADLDDVQLSQAARAAFSWLRRVRAARGNLDPALIPTLVDLQREFVRRFPTGDLSAPSD
jgi:hypothetical protein